MPLKIAKQFGTTNFYVVI